MMNSMLDGLPKAIQAELIESIEKQNETTPEAVRVSKYKQAKTFLSLKKKYNFRRNRIGMN